MAVARAHRRTGRWFMDLLHVTIVNVAVPSIMVITSFSYTGHIPSTCSDMSVTHRTLPMSPEGGAHP
jgi:hypothetical protein